MFVDPARLKTRAPRVHRVVGVVGHTRVPVRIERLPARRDLSTSAPRRRRHRAHRPRPPRRCSCRAGPGQGAGSKIGLFVSRGVAEAQGGRTWGEVADGRLTFHLELPDG